MRKKISWLLLITTAVIISIILFITGKQHKVFVMNGQKGMENIPKVVEYSLDGQKFKKVRARKKGATDIKGANHVLVFKYTNLEGEKIEVSKKFKAKLNKIENIDFVKIIQNKKDWIEYTEIKN